MEKFKILDNEANFDERLVEYAQICAEGRRKIAEYTKRYTRKT